MTYQIMYDVSLRKPGCVLIQALGGTVPKELFFELFGDSNCWLVALTPDMKLYATTEEELRQIAKITDFKRGGSHDKANV